MKRLTIILLLVAFSLPMIVAKEPVSSDDIFQEFASEKQAESVTVNSFLMWIAKRFVGNEPGSEVLNKISSVKVLDLESCSPAVKSRFAERAKFVDVKGMEPLVEANDDGDKVKVLAKIKDETIHRILIMSYGNNDCCLVEVNGKFKLDELDSVVKSQMPKKK